MPTITAAQHAAPIGSPLHPNQALVQRPTKCAVRPMRVIGGWYWVMGKRKAGATRRPSEFIHHQIAHHSWNRWRRLPLLHRRLRLLRPLWRILLQFVHHDLNRALELQVVAGAQGGWIDLDRDIRRDAVILDLPIAVRREQRSARCRHRHPVGELRMPPLRSERKDALSAGPSRSAARR